VPALRGDAVDRHIATQIGQAYAVNPAAYAAVRAAARAVYAERASTGLDPSNPDTRSSSAGMNTFDTGLMNRVLRQVAPTVSFNGQAVPPPVRDGRLMTEAEFREQMDAIPPHVLSGVRASNGAAITGDMIRRHGTLIAVGEGRYGVSISGYRVSGADGRPFVLDARQQWPAAPEAPATLGNADQVARGRQAFAFFTSQGWAPHHAAALVAQISAESGFNPAATHDGGIGVGILGWNRTRRAALGRFIGRDSASATFEEQLSFMHHELTAGDEQPAGRAIRATGSADQAGDVASRVFVRPADIAGEARRRSASSNVWLQALRGAS